MTVLFSALNYNTPQNQNISEKIAEKKLLPFEKELDQFIAEIRFFIEELTFNEF